MTRASSSGTVNVEFTPPPRTSGAAVASLLAGVFGIGLPFLGPLAALILGLTARSRIRKSSGRLTGGGIALAGGILGVLGIVVHILAASLVALLYPAAQQAAALQELAAKENWEAAADLVTGPGSMPKDELMNRFREAEKRYGKITGYRFAGYEVDPDMSSSPLELPLTVKADLVSEGGPAHAVVRVRRMNGRFQVLHLEFKHGPAR